MFYTCTGVCDPACVNGECINGKCQCIDGWIGEACDKGNEIFRF